MAYKFNIFTGTLDLVNPSSTGSGNVTGVPPTDINAITRWADTTGTTIKNSPGTVVQDGGAIEAQGFITRRHIVEDVTVRDGEDMIAGDIDLDDGVTFVIEGDGSLILI